jgi:hypothetical protein
MFLLPGAKKNDGSEAIARLAGHCPRWRSSLVLILDADVSFHAGCAAPVGGIGEPNARFAKTRMIIGLRF